MAYSTLSALSNDSNLTDGATITHTENNTHRTNYRGLSNSLLTEGTAAEKHRASGTEPTDKDEGIIWCDTTNDPAELKFYKDGAGNLFTLASLDAANAFTGANSFAGVTTIPTGTAAAPSIAITGDTDTGIYSTGADKLAFTLGGTLVAQFRPALGLDMNALGVRTDSGGTTEFIRTKTIEIGDWNMNATAFVNVAHGLTLAKIRDVDCMLRNDAASEQRKISIGSGSTGTTPQGFVAGIGSTNVTLIRLTGGGFDNTAWDATTFNRGWIFIKYAI